MEKVINARALGANVKRWREDMGLTVEKLAEYTETSPSHINNIESASSGISAEKLVRIANALEVPLDLLLCDSLKGEANRQARIMEYYTLLEDCTEAEAKIIMTMLYTLKKELKMLRKAGK
ncbi:MAG: helix-turn-helix transcriptional regulator [Lachnospiraceae bacterium]|nr:helix-turn-helix transcriptional regulator [Lachnospiraceae bacterium]